MNHKFVESEIDWNFRLSRRPQSSSGSFDLTTKRELMTSAALIRFVYALALKHCSLHTLRLYIAALMHCGSFSNTKTSALSFKHFAAHIQ